MAAATALSFSLSLLLLFHASLAQFGIGPGSQRRFGSKPGQCQIKRLNALDPTRRVRSEAGVTEYFDIDSSEELQCAGVTAYRRTLEPRGLAVPSYFNSPRIVYVVQGSGIMGVVIPGCPETFQSIQETGAEKYQEHGREQPGQSFREDRDEHQRIQHIKEGDVIALPAGVAVWSYNDGDKSVVTITVVDISNNANQLDRNHREFLLAGKQKSSSGQESFKERGEETSGNNNILSGFDLDLLSQATGLNREVVRHIQGKDDERGEMIRVDRGLEVLRPSRKEREQREQEEEWGRKWMPNGLDETYCSMRIMENIGDPSFADVYTPRGGRITTLNSHKLPILGHVQLSAERVVLYRNALLMPHWNINAHSIVYVTRGRGRVQIVGNQGRLVFDGEIRQGQILVVPQNFAVIKKAQNEGLEMIAVKTNSNAMVSQVTGKASVLRGIPENVLTNAYRISNKDVKQLKFKWDQMGIISAGAGRSEREYSDA